MGLPLTPVGFEPLHRACLPPAAGLAGRAPRRLTWRKEFRAARRLTVLNAHSNNREDSAPSTFPSPCLARFLEPLRGRRSVIRPGTVRHGHGRSAAAVSLHVQLPPGPVELRPLAFPLAAAPRRRTGPVMSPLGSRRVTRGGPGPSCSPTLVALRHPRGPAGLPEHPRRAWKGTVRSLQLLRVQKVCDCPTTSIPLCAATSRIADAVRGQRDGGQSRVQPGDSGALPVSSAGMRATDPLDRPSSSEPGPERSGAASRPQASHPGQRLIFRTLTNSISG